MSFDRLSKEELLKKVLEAIQTCGWRFRVKRVDHPFRISVSKDEIYDDLRIYIWNVTHGGGEARPVDEYRIQLTGVPDNRLDLTPPAKTLLLGWDDGKKVFVGYNAFRYSTFGHSPSLQVKEGTLRKAERDGVAVQPKEKDGEGNVTEIVVAFKPEYFISYASNLDKFHRAVLTNEELGLLQQACIRRVHERELTILPEERRRAIRQVNQAIRKARFRQVVLEIYGHRCAICGLQLGLVEASHIVPVEHGGTDEPVNGLALCPTHHEALDRGLVIIKPDYYISVNQRYIEEAKSAGMAGGLNKFLENLRVNEKIYLPHDSKFNPRPEYLRQRMRLGSR